MVSTYLGAILLPVNPLEEVSFSVGTSSKTYDIISVGEVSELGNRKQITISLKSLFLKKMYPFAASYGVYVDEILKMMNDKKPVRFLIVGDGVNINLLCSIEDFKYDMPYGELNEYYYSLSLREYREHTAKKVVAAPTGVSTVERRMESSGSAKTTSVSTTLSAIEAYQTKRAQIGGG